MDRMAKKEKSCGVIAYKTLGNVNYYLLIRAYNGDVGFPKGHVEEGESEVETAIRELREETNAAAEIIDGFREVIEYTIPSKRYVTKTVVYFLGRCAEDDIIPQRREVKDALFAPYDEAMRLITFEDSRKMLTKAENLIRKISD